MENREKNKETRSNEGKENKNRKRKMENRQKKQETKSDEGQ